MPKVIKVALIIAFIALGTGIFWSVRTSKIAKAPDNTQNQQEQKNTERPKPTVKPSTGIVKEAPKPAKPVVKKPVPKVRIRHTQYYYYYYQPYYTVASASASASGNGSASASASVE